VVQGFYYSRPVNAEAFEKLLKDGFLNVKKV
jgi:EAL domain-containing protein (putative c-di-GMP-specific phosphodiesterase class I)